MGALEVRVVLIAQVHLVRDLDGGTAAEGDEGSVGLLLLRDGLVVALRAVALRVLAGEADARVEGLVAEHARALLADAARRHVVRALRGARRVAAGPLLRVYPRVFGRPRFPGV